MGELELLRSLQRPATTKIVLLVFDGLGGLPLVPEGSTELEAAATPNLDRLAQQGALGQTIPIRPGITPGSGPAHLALFGYDPLEYVVGRGALEATGVGLHVALGDVAVRGNFCTLDQEGKITDRRAGRIRSAESAPLLDRLSQIHVPGASIEARLVREYRFALLARGEGLVSTLSDTDPQATGLAPLPVRAETPAAQSTADLFNAWIAEATAVLAGEPKANGLTLRGFSTNPDFPLFPQIYGLRAACIAVYPMYRGVSRLVGMDVIEFEGETPEAQIGALRQAWDRYDFFFVHIKKTDSKGEDGDFDGKSAVIESVDALVPTLLELQPDVLAVTGDHSTPARLRSHSWHPVPFLLWAPATVRPDLGRTFGERACSQGDLGTFPASQAMALMLGHAGRLDKFGA